MQRAFFHLRIPLFLSALILFGGLWLYTRGNTFPYNYHPDEPVKVKQLLASDYNFHHPLLLLSSANGVRALLHAGDDPQKVVEAGRLVSAIFATLGVLAFMWTGWLKGGDRGGPWVAALVTALLLPHHQVFELAHYLKEDTALFLGVGLTFLALAWAARVKTPASVALLGAAAGLAFSGKYLGITVGIAALAWVIFSREETIRARRKSLLLLFGAGFLVVATLINFPFFLHWDSVQSSFEREMDMVVNGQGGVTRQVPNWQYTAVFLDNTHPIIWLGLAGCLYFGWRARRQLTLEQWLPVIFGLGFAVMLSFSPKSNDRYFLPLTGMTCLAAAYGLFHLAAAFKKPWWQWVGLIIALGSSLPGLARYDAAFQVDDRRDFRNWLLKEMPANAVIVQEKNVRVPGSGNDDPESLLPQKFLTARFAPDLGTVDELEGKGVSHLLISQSNYGKFFLSSLRPEEGERALFEARKAFYSRTFQEGKLLWKRPRSTVIYLHPGLEFYEITPP